MEKPLFAEPVKKIIVRMPNWLGDAVMATPVLADLRSKWRNAEIVAMCQPSVAQMIKEDPHIDEIFSFKKVSGWIHRVHRSDIVDALQLGDYDLGVLLTNSFSSAWWFWRGKVHYRIGFADHWRSLLLNKAVSYPKNKETQHLVITYKMLLEPLGIPVSDSAPTLYLLPEEKKQVREILLKYNITDSNRVVGINPGAAYGTAKCWLPERFKAVTQELLKSDPNIRVIYFGDPTGAPLVHEICSEFSERVVNLAGKTSLRELIGMIERCNVFLTNDSGPMHIASALGTPLVALFGSTSDVKTGPYNGGKVIHKHVECSPCYKRVCPIDFRCMKRIEVDEVVQSLLTALQQKKS